MASETDALLACRGIQTSCTDIHSAKVTGTEEPSVFNHSKSGVSVQEIGSCGLACIGSLSMGLALGYSSPVNADFLRFSILTEDQCSWFSALLNLGAILGGPLAGFLVEKMGRKTTVMLTALPYVFGWLLIAASGHPYVIYIGRTLTGLGVGMTSLCVPLYLAEVAPKEKRGALGSGYQIGSTIGILILFSVSLSLEWRWLAIFSAIFPSLLVISMILLPESPRWLLMRRSKEECLVVLQWLRRGKTKEEIAIECEEMEVSVIEQKAIEQFSWSHLFTEKSLRSPLILSLLLMIFQQFCGINAVIFYTHSIFETSGYEGDSGMPSVIVSSVKVVITVFTTTIIDRAGRRALFILGGLGMALSCLALGLYYFLTIQLEHSSSQLSWVSLASLIIYVISFSLGWGAIPWVIMSEVFPTRARGMASGIATAVNWSCSFLVTKMFVPLQGLILPYGVFWLFCGVCVVGTLYGLLCMIETKGKSLEEIERGFEHGLGSCC